MNQTVAVGASDCPIVVFRAEEGEIAVAWLKALLGLIKPEQFLEVVVALMPSALPMAETMLKHCLGVGA